MQITGGWRDSKFKYHNSDSHYDSRPFRARQLKRIREAKRASTTKTVGILQV
jgi:hypothetical protein